MDAALRATLRAGERVDAARVHDQDRQLRRGDVVKYAACGCLDRFHDDPDHMDYVRDIGSALEDGLAMGVGQFHIIRVVVEEVDV